MTAATTLKRNRFEEFMESIGNWFTGRFFIWVTILGEGGWIGFCLPAFGGAEDVI